MTHSQSQSSAAKEKWTEIIEDLWKKHLPHFQDEEKLYDDNCLKFDCVTLQFGDREESDSDSETWLHKNTTDMKDSRVKVNETEEECELIISLSAVVLNSRDRQAELWLPEFLHF